MSASSDELFPKVADKASTVPAPLIAERVALGTSMATLALLVALHFISPELDPSWRMVSEYALGNYSRVLSLMFGLWALSSWALASAIWSQVKTTSGKIGLFFLIAAGIGEAMGAAFDIKHSLHGLAALIGIPSLPVASMLISSSLACNNEWSSARKTLLWTANLTWISLLLLIATFILMMATFAQTGIQVDPNVTLTALPEGVIGLVGWANRLLIFIYCLWVMTVAWLAGNVTQSRN